MKLIDLKVSLDQLMLDPNNYRLDKDPQQQKCPDNEIESKQEATQKKLEKQKLEELRESIRENGFLEMDRIVVRKLNSNKKTPFFVIVEGNRRAAAFKGLIESYHEGLIDLPRSLIAKSKSIGVICIEGTKEEIKSFSMSLMGIRHVSGPKKWSGYQSARLIDELHEEGKSFEEIGALLGCSAHDAIRRRRGYRAFMQMRTDKNYGPKTKSNHYALLLEFLSPKKEGLKWLGWNESKLQFGKKNNLERVYDAITPNDDEFTEIKNPTAARKFQDYLAIDKFRKGIELGTRMNELPPLTPSIKQLEEFIYLLKDIKTRSITKHELEYIMEIYGLVERILNDEGAL